MIGIAILQVSLTALVIAAVSVFLFWANGRFKKLEDGQAKLENGQAELKKDIADIKESLKAIQAKT